MVAAGPRTVLYRVTSSMVPPSEYDEQKVLTCRETENTTVYRQKNLLINQDADQKTDY